MAQRWKITIEYDGSFYAGWQRQKQDGILSVQQALEEAIEAFSGEFCPLVVSGRTDAGVHALGQVAHFDVEKDFAPRTICNAINAKLHTLRHEGVTVLQAEKVSDDFHARFSAIYRTYCYRILSGRQAPVVLGAGRFLHNRAPLDLEAMQEGANHLLGHHDFSSFRATACQANGPMRTLDRVDIVDCTARSFYTAQSSEKATNTPVGQSVEIWVGAKSFLYNQVRNIVGSLIPVGEGKWPPEKIKEILDACDRTKGGKTAPAHGLYFMQVDFDTD